MTAIPLPPYNGWANYPTWAIFTWLTNEEPLMREAERRTAAAHGSPALAADNLREWVETLIAESFDAGCLALDLANFAASHCAWRNLTTALDQTIAETSALADGRGDYEDTPAYRLDR